ncbi:MAG: hypothetical protein GX810_06355, partial [Clostridiales bacterium]|nr:hypothetical protein [Clostridiales bacterium]
PPHPSAYEPISVPLAATQDWSGKQLTAGAFTFELLDVAGKAIQEATNAADGSITFADRTAYRVTVDTRPLESLAAFAPSAPVRVGM